MRIGTDLAVSRGDMDVSEMCTVTSLRPECVRYVPETEEPGGRVAGARPGGLYAGRQDGQRAGRGLPGGRAGKPLEGDVRIEPASTILAPGQAEPLRVYVGRRRSHRRGDPGQLRSEGGR